MSKWKIDNTELNLQHTFTLADNETINVLPKKDDNSAACLEFQVMRYKDTATGREILKVTAFLNDNKYGEISASIGSLSYDLINFNEYGIIIKRILFNELATAIKENYYVMNVNYTSDIDYKMTDDIISKIMIYICDYIKSNNILMKIVNKKQIYPIPTCEFNECIADSSFCKYNISDIKQELQRNNYTLANKNRADCVIKIKDNDNKGKTFKAICIYKDIYDKFSGDIEDEF